MSPAMTTACTATSCYGRIFEGQHLRCPNCGSTLVTYQESKAYTSAYKAVATAKRAVA